MPVLHQRLEYTRICLDRVLNKYRVLQDSNYRRILNMYGLHRVLNMPRYGSIYLKRTWICRNMFESMIIDRALNMARFWICLIQYKTGGHSTSSWILFERWAYLKPCQKSKTERSGKIMTAFNYFLKTLHLKSFGGIWISIGF